MAMTVLTIGTKAAATDSTPVLFEFVIFLASSLPPPLRHADIASLPPGRATLRRRMPPTRPTLVAARLPEWGAKFGPDSKCKRTIGLRRGAVR
jgi:hypothetical protein